MKTGRPVKVRSIHRSPRGNTQACPSAMGGKDQQPCATTDRARHGRTARPTLVHGRRAPGALAYPAGHG